MALILVLRPMARLLGLVDIPNERKQHDGEIPLIGGIAIFSAVLAAHGISELFLPDNRFSVDYISFYSAGALLVLVGMIDDYRELSPTVRLVTQVFASLVIIFGGGQVVNSIGTMSLSGQAIHLGIFSVPFTVFAIVGLTNAVNMSDGLDGLAGSLALVPIVGFIVATVFFDDGLDLVILCGFAASITAFLFFNVTVPGMRRALIFLGDSGSMYLGLTLAWIAIRFTQGDQPIISPAAALWFMMLPVFDAVCMTSRRIIRRRPPFTADREHLHHIFLLAGFTVTETVAIMAGLATMGVIVGLVGTYYELSDRLLAGSFLVLGLGYFWMIVRSWAVMRFLRRSICRRRSMRDRRTSVDRRRSAATAYGGEEKRNRIDRRALNRRDADR